MNHAVARKGTLTVAVFEQNALGQRFYERYGFVEIGRSRHLKPGFPWCTCSIVFPIPPLSSSPLPLGNSVPHL